MKLGIMHLFQFNSYASNSREPTIGGTPKSAGTPTTANETINRDARNIWKHWQ
jgi:hypothetical protein